MRVHHLDCASFSPFGGRLIDGSGRVLRQARMVTHTLLVETEAGLVLVDTGYGLQDIESPRARLGAASRLLFRPRLDPAKSALRQIEWLGYRREDVRHVILTHLDRDHAGGLPDFPGATVHVHSAELHAATIRATTLERERYQPAHWAHGPRWQTYDVRGERWFGFDAVQQLEGLPPELLIVPLPGHTRGHCGVAVQTPRGWILHAGDAYFFHGEVHEAQRRCPPALSLLQRLIEIDPIARRHNQERLRALVREQAGTLRVFCSHDAEEFASAQAAG